MTVARRALHLLLLIVLVAAAGSVVTAAVSPTPAHAAGTLGVDDYPDRDATDCSAQFGVYSWCKGGSWMSPRRFAYRNCTDFVAYRVGVSWGDLAFPGGDGNARGWKQGAINSGYQVSSTPAVGAVAWWGANSQGMSSFGHVAVVVGVNGDGSARVEQYNGRGDGTYSVSAAVRADAYLYIHLPTAGGGRQPDGTLIRTPAGDIYRVVGGAPLHLASCEPFDGCSGYVSVPDLSAYLPTPADGATLTAVDTGRVYKFVGGAPVWLATCAGGCGTPWGVNQWTVDVGDHMNPVPADGATLATADTGRVYKIVGGAPLWLASCEPGCGNPVAVDQPTVDRSDHLRPVPADGATLVAQDTGRVYKIAGGYPMWLGSCDVGCGSPVPVDQWTVDVRDHLSAVVSPGTFVRFGSGVGAGTVARAAGGSLLPLSTCDPVGGCSGYVDVNDGTFRSYVDGHPHPVDGTVVAGAPSGRLLAFAGGCASPVTGAAPVTTIDDGGLDGIGRCLTISSTVLPGAVWKTAFSTTLAATGGSGTLTWSVISGKLPPGVGLAPTGAVSGTPSVAGTFRFVVRVSDSSSPLQSATQTMTLRVAAVAVATSSLPGGVVGKPVSTTLTASGGAGAKTWTVSSGALPAGVTLSGAGRLTGTPTAAGTFRFGVTVTDSASPADTATRTLQLTVAPIAVRTTALRAGVVGAAYSQTLLAWGGTAPLTWKVAGGALPAGVTLSAAGVLSGKPTTAGSFDVTVRVLDAQRRVATASWTLSVS